MAVVGDLALDVTLLQGMTFKRDSTSPPATGAPEPHGPVVPEDIYDQHALLLRRIATDRFGVPRAEAEALVHDIFLTYLADPSHVREVRSYLVGAICNASRNYWRSKHYENALFTADTADQHPDASWNDAADLRLMVSFILSRLRPQCRETLRRYYLDGETTEDIAMVMGTTKAYVFKLLSTCRKDALRACLAAGVGSVCNI